METANHETVIQDKNEKIEKLLTELEVDMICDKSISQNIIELNILGIR